MTDGDNTRRDERALGANDASVMISREILRIHHDSYGTAGNSCQTFIVGDQYVLVVMDNDVTTAERTLLDGGKGEAVRETRMAFQEAIESTFKAVVERATGRTVDAFISHLHLDPMFTVELFRLAPQRADELREPE
jgi:uncharacterized protein YbcI